MKRFLLPVLFLMIFVSGFFVIGFRGGIAKDVFRDIDVVTFVEDGDRFESAARLHDLGIRDKVARQLIIGSQRRLFSMICHPETNDKTQGELIAIFVDLKIPLTADESKRYRKHMNDTQISESRKNLMFLYLGRITNDLSTFTEYVAAFKSDNVQVRLSAVKGVSLLEMGPEALSRICRLKLDDEAAYIKGLARHEIEKLVALKDPRGLVFLLEGLKHKEQYVSHKMVSTHAKLVFDGFALPGAEAVIRELWEKDKTSMKLRLAMTLFSGDGKPSAELIDELRKKLENKPAEPFDDTEFSDESFGIDKISMNHFIHSDIIMALGYYPSVVEPLRDILIKRMEDSETHDFFKLSIAMLFDSCQLEQTKADAMMKELLDSESSMVVRMARAVVFDLK